MATPREFMERVVAWPSDNELGYVNIHTFRADKKRPDGSMPIFGKPFRNLDELMNYVQYCAGNPGKHYGVYFCTSTQRDLSSKGAFPSALRNKPNALWLKALWFDIDIGKKDSYATLNDALDAVTAFRNGTNLPAPSALVATGGGLHVYWISDKRLATADWQGYADGLKATAQAYGLKADLQCTADAARILRVPGTFNCKYGQPRAVKILFLGPDHDFASVFAHIRQAPRAITAPVTANPFPNTATWGAPPALTTGLTDNLSDGIDRYEKLPLDPRPMFQQCQHFRGTLKSGGKSDPEPLWMLNLLAATFMDNGQAIGHKLSSRYPAYTPEETDKKFEERLRYKAEKNLGWPSCTSFEGAGAKCLGCPFRGVIRSPLNLCVTKAAPVAAPAVEEPLPSNYCVVEGGIICEIVGKKLAGGEVSEEKHPLFMTRLRNFDVRNVAGSTRCELRFDVNYDVDNWRNCAIGETDLSTEQKLMGKLRDIGVKPYPRNKGRIEHFMTSFMAKLDAQQYRGLSVPFGWLYDPKGGEIPIGFAYSGKVYMADGTEKEASAADPTFGPLYTPKGDASSQPWRDLLKMVTDQHHPALEALVAVSFAAPLLIGSGLYNAVVCGWSPEAGSHKSTSLHIGAAVWGEPKRTKEKPNATQKGIMKKTGEIKNLPVYWDEISDDKRLSLVRTMIGEMTEGGIGTRLRSDRTAFAYDDWQTILCVAANQSLIDNILAHVKDTDAQLQRVFEFQVEKRRDTARPHDVSLMTGSLDHNYGYIGQTYAKVLGSNPQAIMTFVKQVIDKFVAEVQCSSEARYRSAVAAVLWAGAALANHNLKTTFNLDELWTFLKKEFLAANDAIARAEVVAGQRENTINAMTQFFKGMTRNTLWVTKMPVIVGKGHPWAINRRAGPTAERPDPIHVRCCETDHLIEVSKQRMFEFFQQHGLNAGATLQALRNHFRAKEVKRIDLSYGSGVAGGRETIVSIPVTNTSPFTNVLYKHAPIEERPAGVVIDDEGVTEPVTASANTPLFSSPTDGQATKDDSQS